MFRALFIFFLVGVINYLYRLVTALYLWTNNCTGMAEPLRRPLSLNCEPGLPNSFRSCYVLRKCD